MSDFPTKTDTICSKCSLSTDSRITNPCMMGQYSKAHLHTVNRQCDVMVIVEAPTYEDEKFGIIFSDPNYGVFLRRTLIESGIDDYYITFAVKCNSLSNKKIFANGRVTDRYEPLSPPPVVIKACNPYFQKELDLVHPKYVLMLGNPALTCGKKKSGMSKYHGQPLRDGATIYFATYNPASFVYNKKNINDYIDDMKIFSTIVNTGGDTTISTKPVNYKYINTIPMFIDMVKELKEKKLFSFDIETSNLSPWNPSPHFKTPPSVLCIAFSTEPNTAWLLPIDHPDTPFTVEERSTIKKVLKVIMEDESLAKVMQNAKFDTKYIRVLFGIETKNLIFDTMLASYLLNEEGGEHGLKDLALRYTDLGNYDEELERLRKKSRFDSMEEFDRIANFSGLTFSSQEEKDAMFKKGIPKTEEYNYALIAMTSLFKYAACDADATIRLYHIFKDRLEKEDMLSTMDMMIMFSDSVTEVEFNGAMIDQEYVRATDLDYIKKIDDHRKNMYSYHEIKEIQEYYSLRESLHWLRKSYLQEIEDSKLKTLLFSVLPKELNGVPVLEFFDTLDKCNMKDKLTMYREVYAKTPDLFRGKGLQPFNFNSSAYLSDLIYEYLGEKVTKRTESKAPSTDEEVINSIADKYEIIKEIAVHKKLMKFYTTYVNPVLSSWMCSDGLIHSNYKLHGTATGRLSSTKPNMQNLPRDDKVVKNMFISRFHGGFIVNADYSQIELRILAVYSMDAKLIEFYNSGKDLHTQTAATILKKPFEEVTSDERQIFKSINFLIVYGGTPKALAAQTGITEEEAQGFMNDYFAEFPGVGKYMEEFKNFAIANKFIWTKTKRKRRLPNVDSDKEFMREEAYRIAINTPIQSTASDITQTSMARLQKVFKKMSLHSLVIGTVHDSIMFDVHPSEVITVYKIIKAVMENPPYDFCRNPDGSYIVPYKCDIGMGRRYGDTKDLSLEDDILYVVVKDKATGNKTKLPYYEYNF